MSRIAAVLLSIVSVGVLAAGSMASARADATPESLVTRFHAKKIRMPASYRARRHLEAENQRFNKSGWIDVVTEFAADRLSYTVTGRGGSELVQSQVLLPALDGERELWAEGREPFALTDANYQLEDATPDSAGVPRIRLPPRREDRRLIDGWMLLSPDAEVLQVSGRLAKSPSFWTRSVMLSQRYTSIRGVHLPISVTSVADVRVVGRSTFRMTYTYELVDGVRVGNSM